MAFKGNMALVEELLASGRIGKANSLVEAVNSNAKYKNKYKKLRKYMKALVFENAALCDHVSQTQEKLLLAKEERRFLLKKLLSHQAAADPDGLHHVSTSPAGSSFSASKKVVTKKKSPAEMLESLKVMKLKKPSGSKVKRAVQQIQLDATGRPIFPIDLGGLTIHSLGEVVGDRSAYHSEDYIFPVGFCSTRVYGSLSNPENKCIYTCKILDGGDAPLFEIAADGEPNLPIVGPSPSYCHARLLQNMNGVVGIEVVNTDGRGPEFFGLSHSTVQNLIQSSPGARKCSGYQWQKFEVCRSNTPPKGSLNLEDNDASLSFDALQRNIAFSKSHLSYTVKEEVVELDVVDSGSCFKDLLGS